MSFYDIRSLHVLLGGFVFCCIIWYRCLFMIYDHFTYYLVDLFFVALFDIDVFLWYTITSRTTLWIWPAKGKGYPFLLKKIVCRGGGGPTCYVTLDKIWKMIFERFPDFAPKNTSLSLAFSLTMYFLRSVTICLFFHFSAEHFITSRLSPGEQTTTIHRTARKELIKRFRMCLL